MNTFKLAFAITGAALFIGLMLAIAIPGAIRAGVMGLLISIATVGFLAWGLWGILYCIVRWKERGK